MDIVRRQLSPELLNRIDETVLFNRLQPEHMADIVDIQLEKLKARAYDGPKLILDIDDDVKSKLGEMGYDVRYGARPLKRTIQKHVEDLIASEILNSMINEGDTINIDYTSGKDELNIKIQNKKESKTSKK